MQIWGYILSPPWAIHPAPAKPGMQSQAGALPQPRQAITPLKARPFGNFLPPLGVFDCDNCGHCDNRMDIGFACPQFVRSRAKSADKFKCKSGFLHISGHFSRKPVHDRTRYRTFSKSKRAEIAPPPFLHGTSAGRPLATSNQNAPMRAACASSSATGCKSPPLVMAVPTWLVRASHTSTGRPTCSRSWAGRARMAARMRGAINANSPSCRAFSASKATCFGDIWGRTST